MNIFFNYLFVLGVLNFVLAVLDIVIVDFVLTAFGIIVGAARGQATNLKEVTVVQIFQYFRDRYFHHHHRQNLLNPHPHHHLSHHRHLPDPY